MSLWAYFFNTVTHTYTKLYTRHTHPYIFIRSIQERHQVLRRLTQKHIHHECTYTCPSCQHWELEAVRLWCHDVSPSSGEIRTRRGPGDGGCACWYRSPYSHSSRDTHTHTHLCTRTVTAHACFNVGGGGCRAVKAGAELHVLGRIWARDWSQARFRWSSREVSGIMGRRRGKKSDRHKMGWWNIIRKPFVTQGEAGYLMGVVSLKWNHPSPQLGIWLGHK